MQRNFSTATHLTHALEAQNLINNRKFIMGVVLPLGIGVSSYALTATGMIIYDIFTKIL